MLALGDGGLEGFHAALGDVLRGGLGVGSVRWPHLGQQQVVDFAVSRVVGQGLGKVLKVAVDVHVFMGHPAHMRKTMRVECVDVEHGHALRTGRVSPNGVLQRVDLHTRAAIALDPMASAADDQQAMCIRVAVEHHVHGQSFTVAPSQGVKVGVHCQAGGLGGSQEFVAGLGIAGGKVGGVVVHALPGQAVWVGLASHCVASSTQ